MSKKITILYSGGLDSFIMVKLAKSLGYDYNLVHFDIGQEYNEKELKAIKDSGFDVEIRNVDWLTSKTVLSGKQENNSGNIFIPGRNMVLSSLAASIYLPDEVWLGGLKGEDHAQATDKNEKFVQKTNKLWEHVYSPFDTVPKLVFPLVDKMWGKFEAVEWAVQHAPIEDILSTSSCLSGEPGNCGTCVVCCRRKYIFKQLGFKEEYNKDPLESASNLKMLIEMLETPVDAKDADVHYDSWRRREIIPGLYLEFDTDNNKLIINILKQKLNVLEGTK